MLPRTHGSALFTRGETQALAVATLGTARAALRSDNLSDEDDRHFYLQYFFPPSSVGEVRVTTHDPWLHDSRVAYDSNHEEASA